MLKATTSSISRALFAFSVGLATAAFLVIPYATPAQTPETIINGPCEICKPKSVEAANFDGGATDLVVGETATGEVTFYSGTGSGSGTDRLGSGTLVATSASSPEALASGDLMADSNRDLVVANADVNENEILIFPGNGDGTFGSATTLSAPDSPSDLVVADIDGSNGLDVAVAGAFAIKVYLNDGNGNFGTPEILNGGDTSIDAADLGGDGDVDLVAVDAFADELVAFEWDSGSFTERTITTGFASPEHIQLLSANPDTDSNLDVVAYSDNGTGNPNLAWFAGNGDGTFGNTANAVTTSATNFFELLTGDFTGNGNADLVTVGDDTNLYNNTGSGFGSASSFASFSLGAGAAVATNFTSGDTDLDLVATPFRTDLIGLRTGDGSGGFSSETVVAPPDLRSVTSSMALATGDVDNSNGPDVIFAGADNGVVWYPNDGTGQFGAFNQVVLDLPNDIVIKDVDDDGREDLFVAGSFFSLTRQESTSGGGFTSTTIHGGATNAVDVAELDADNQYDVVYATSSAITVGLNQGSGSFSTTDINTSVGSVQELHLADVTDDGNLDAVFADATNNEIAYHAGNGDGTFNGTKQVVASPSGPTRLFARDLNGDTHPDLVGNVSGGGVKVYLYDSGNGSFGSGTEYTGENAAITLADVNGNDFPDLIQGTTWRANDGAGSFGSATSYASIPGVTAVGATTVDGDADLDPVTATETLDKLSWFENQGSVLPVELASFKGTQTGEDIVRLTWQTTSETNNAGFRVQKKSVKASRTTGMTSGPRDASTASTEATEADWQTLGRVDGAGTTDQPQSYRFVAEDLAPGTHQFRLQQVDLDGTAHLHDPITVEIGMQQPVRLTAPAPHPVQDRATLSFAVKEVQETTVTLYNLLGQQVATLYRGTPPAGEAQSLPLDASTLASGTYVVRLQAGSRTKIRRVTVVH